MSTKTKGITHGIVNFFWLRLAYSKIKFTRKFRVHIHRINSGWNNTFVYTSYTGDGFNGAGSAEQMTCHGFGGAQMHRGKVFAK